VLGNDRRSKILITTPAEQLTVLTAVGLHSLSVPSEGDVTRIFSLHTGSVAKYKPAMRAVIQRVSQASVVIEGSTKGSIGLGLVVLLAVEDADTPEDVEWLSGKIVRLRVFPDDNGVMNRSVQEAGGGILLISQFTLFASTRKGNRPSYSRSARPEIAIPLYDSFLRKLSEDLGKPVEAGEFGADMQVSLTNDGPVTIIMDSKLRE
jgi:D-tyrosyl-tRNA(Tyr) deacylase